MTPRPPVAFLFFFGLILWRYAEIQVRDHDATALDFQDMQLSGNEVRIQLINAYVEDMSGTLLVLGFSRCHKKGH